MHFPADGVDCLDLCGGNGAFIIYLAKQFPKSNFWNLDIHRAAHNKGNEQAAKLGLHNTFFELKDACDLPEDWLEKFSYATIIISLHDLPFPVKTIEKLHSVMKQGGYVSVLEATMANDPWLNAKISINSIFYCISLFYCLGVSLAVEGSAALGIGVGCQTLISILEQGGFTMKKISSFPFSGASITHLLCQK